MLKRYPGTLVLIFGLLVPFVSGCSALVPTPEPVTISFVHPDDPTGSYEQWVQQFQEQYPYVTVELHNAREVNTNQLPNYDGFVATQFEQAGFSQQQAILDLSAFVEQSSDLDPAGFYPATLEVFRSQGRQWAIPFEIDMAVIYYNRDLFDRYNVPYPQVGWTWGDFLDRALGTTDLNADVYGYALQYEGDISVYEPLMMIYQHGGGVFDSLQSPTEATLDNPLNIEAMDFYASLPLVHHVSPTAEEAQRLGQPYPWRGVFDDHFAMWMGMLSSRGALRRFDPNEPLSWGVAPMPRDQAASSLAVANGFFISASSEHPDVVWQWISFLSQQTPPFLMPARQSIAESSAYEEKVGEEAALATRAALEDAILVSPNLLGFESTINAMAQAFAQIRVGELTPDVALSLAQEKTGY